MIEISISDILDSVRIPQFIKDDEIQQGDFLKSNTGNLIHYAGGFTVVFPVTVKDKKWAFRCWHNDTGIDAPRMKVLSDAIAESHLKYLCDFKYEDVGIMVKGKPYPTSRMKWVEGKNINDYLLVHQHESARIKKLAKDFLAMTRELHSRHIAHGDLQQGNIMVNEQGEIFLVDYDSMYCPQMGNVPDIIKGKDDFQHPTRRKNSKATEKLDYFSELIIYTSILAISEDARLVAKYNIDDSLLFKSQDYGDIENSNIYQDLTALGGTFPLLMIFLKDYLSRNNLDELEPLDVLLDRNLKEPEILYFQCVNGPRIIKGNDAIFSFDTKHVTEIELNGNKVPFGLKQFSVKPDKTGPYSVGLKVFNWSSSTSMSIEIEVVDKPFIELKHEHQRLRRGKDDKSLITWKVKNLSNIRLYTGTNGEYEVLASKGHLELSPTHTTHYTIVGIALDEKTDFKKDFTVYVYDESKIDFSVDKSFAFTSIPITFTWNVEHAKKVTFEGDVVKHSGSRVIAEGINRDKEFTLNVTDKFGTKKKTILVRLLPIPIVKSLMVPMPDTNISINVNVAMPSPSLSVKLSDEASNLMRLPNVEFNEVNIPRINPVIQPKFNIPQPIRWWQLSKVYNYFKNKIKRQEYESKR